MKIWFPTIRADSGSDVYVSRIAKSLQSHGVDSLVTWFPPRYEYLPELMRQAEVPEGIDIIHANSWNASVFISAQIPIVATVHHLVHDPEFGPYRSIMQAIYHRANVYWRERKAIRECSAVVSVSKSTANAVKAVFGRESQLIHNWIDSDFGEYFKRDSENIKFVILIAGNAGKRKGSDLLPKLSSLLGDDFEIRVTGGLRSHARDTKTAGNIIFLGSLSESDLLREYAQCDAVISLSRYEGFGYSALEAMSFGKPFVGFCISSLSEVIEDGVAGFLVKVNDIHAIAEKIRLLRNDDGLRKRMGAQGVLRSKNEFSEFIAIQKYIELYKSLLNK
jgi:glycosyltransferase involved in cell wall biosynthesis